MTGNRALLIAFVINVAMAVVEIVAALLSRSVALMADAVDFVEDSVVYLLAYVMQDATEVAERRFGILIAGLMVLPGLGVLWQLWRQMGSTAPLPGVTIWSVSALALVANLVSASVILRARRSGTRSGLGLRAAWLSSRNDALANVAMIIAGLLVWRTGMRWPDIVTGLGVATLHLSGGYAIFRTATEKAPHV